MATVRINVDIPIELKQELKIQAEMRNVTLKEYVNMILLDRALKERSE